MTRCNDCGDMQCSRCAATDELLAEVRNLKAKLRKERQAKLDATANAARLRTALEAEKKHACHCDFREEEEPCDACMRIDAVLTGGKS